MSLFRLYFTFLSLQFYRNDLIIWRHSYWLNVFNHIMSLFSPKKWYNIKWHDKKRHGDPKRGHISLTVLTVTFPVTTILSENNYIVSAKPASPVKKNNCSKIEFEWTVFLYFKMCYAYYWILSMKLLYNVTA